MSNIPRYCDDLIQFEALFMRQKPKKSSLFDIYPSPVGTDQSESNPIHLKMYTGNIIFNFMGNIPRYWGDLIQFEALFMRQKPKKSSLFDIYPSPVGTDQSESNPIHLKMYTGNIIFNFMGNIPRYWGDLIQFEALFMRQKPKNRHFLRFTLHLWVQISQNPTFFTLKCTQGI